MSIYKIDLCHLGDACAPGIIINHILNIKKKTLFMLAVYHFNDIITYLNDNNYENIYNTDLLDISKYPVINIKYNFYHILYMEDTIISIDSKYRDFTKYPNESKFTINYFIKEIFNIIL